MDGNGNDYQGDAKKDSLYNFADFAMPKEEPSLEDIKVILEKLPMEKQLKWILDQYTTEQATKDLMDNVHKALYQPHAVHGNVRWLTPILISQNCRIDVTGDIDFGAMLMMNQGSSILRHKHPIKKKIPLLLQCSRWTTPSKKLVVGDDVWLQQNTTIGPEVTQIHTGTILVFGSILTKNTTDEYGIYAGTPAKLIKYRT